ncbi:MAG: hypothetical protein WCS03_15645 [Bacteroidota bacterium]
MEKLQQLGVIPVDYASLGSLYSSYRFPRNKISGLEKEGLIIRLKRGMYVVSPKISGKLLSTELIANHIYGPSYVSMESALRFYGLVPEMVHIVRSMTTKRSRIFENTLSTFDYINCSDNYYIIGISQFTNDNFTFLIASPEKALCDLIGYTSKLRPRFLKSMRAYLEFDLRLEMEAFFKMDVNILRQCAEVGKKGNELNNLIKLLQR